MVGEDSVVLYGQLMSMEERQEPEDLLAEVARLLEEFIDIFLKTKRPTAKQRA